MSDLRSYLEKLTAHAEELRSTVSVLGPLLQARAEEVSRADHRRFLMKQADTSRGRRREPQMDPELGITLTPAYCTGCGGFLGLEHIEVGAMKILCRTCKKWTTLMGESGLFLTEITNNGNMKG